jgi:hypothetical protein
MSDPAPAIIAMKSAATPSTTSEKRFYVLWVAGALAAVVLGSLIGLSPVAGLTVVGGVALLLTLIFSARGRLLIVLIGGLLVFQSNDTLGPNKIAYLAGTALAVVISLVRLSRSKDRSLQCFRPLLVGAMPLLALLCLSAIVATSGGTPIIAWARDASAYFFVICLPAVALDAGQHFSRKQLETLIVVLGVAAAAGFAIDWISRRHVSSLEVGRLILATTTLVALAFAYLLMKAATGPNRPVWIILSTVTIAMMMVSGTRTNLVLLAAAIGIVGSAAKGRVPIYRLVIQIAFLLLLAGVSIPVLGKLLTDDPQFLSKRISAATAVMTGKFATDGSFLERAHAYATAKAVFLQSPLVGIGPGHAFTAGRSHSHYSTSLDTPWLVPAKLGLLGVAALVFYLASVLVCMARIRQGTGGMEILTVGRGWFAILLFLTPFGPWVEDRGFALALALFVAALSASARENFRGKRDDVPPRSPSLAVSTGDVAQVT